MKTGICGMGGRALDRLCFGGIVLSITLMLVLSTLGIVGRWAGVSWLWIDPLVRHLVLTTAFFGGGLAVGRKAHIRIDVLTKPMESLPAVWRENSERLVALASLAVTGALAWSAWSFFLVEHEFNAQGALFIAILPVGWGLLTLRWALFLGASLENRERR